MTDPKPSLFVRQPALGERLITQNLLVSAASLERTRNPDWEAIQDFSRFVDLYCLYDRTTVIGRGLGDALRNMDSALLSLLEETAFVTVASITDAEAEAVTKTARQHLLTFLGEEYADEYDSLLIHSLNPSNAGYALSYAPDRGEDIAIGRHSLLNPKAREALLRLLKQESVYPRGTTFLVRTFLYLAYSDVTKIPFTPDVTRSSVLETVLDSEARFRDQILATMTQSWQDAPTIGDLDLRRHISPLAAVVTERASPSWSSVLLELKHLREELSSLRVRLRHAEYTALWGRYDESMNAQREWTAVHEELRRSFGTEPNLVVIRGAVGHSETLGKLADSPRSYAAWTKALFGLPMEVLHRMLARRPAIELHRLRPELPATERLRGNLRRLFQS